MRDAIDLDLTESEISESIITPAMHRVGYLWERGEISVADEHLATQITLRVMALEREAFRSARARLDHRVALAAVEGEEHVVGLQMAANLLLHAGYDIAYYGPDLPTGVLETVIGGKRPHVLCLSATMPIAGPSMTAAVEEVHGLDPALVVVVGGNGVPPGMRAQPWLAVERGVTDVVQTVDSLLHRPDLN